MDLTKFFEYMNNQKTVDAESGLIEVFDVLSQEALKITMEINNKYGLVQTVRYYPELQLVMVQL